MASQISIFHFLFILLTFAYRPRSSVAEEEKQLKDCPPDTLDDLPECLPPGTFYMNDDANITCKLTVDESTGKDCPSMTTAPSHGSVNWVINPHGNSTGHDDTTPPPDALTARKGGWSNEQLIKDCMTEDSTTLITSGHSQETGCYSFSVPVCQDAKHVLNIWIAGGTSDKNKYRECYHLKVNGKRLDKIVFSIMVKRKVCQKTEILANLKVDKGQTEVMNGKLVIPISGGVMSVDVCLNDCVLAPHEQEAQVITIYMEKRAWPKLKPCGSEGSTTPKTISSTTPKTVSSTTPKTISSTTPKTISSTTPKTVSSTTPKTISSTTPKTISSTIPKTVSSTTPKTISSTTPKTISSTTPKTISSTTPKTVSSTTPKTISSTTPKTVSSTTPKTISSTTPKTISSTIQSTVSSTTPKTVSSTTPKTISSTTLKTISSTTLKTISSTTPKPTSNDNLCKSYNGTIPSRCWAHGCQYLGGKCVTVKMSCEAKAYPKCHCSHVFCDFWGAKDKECSHNPPIFDKKLTCRRPNTHYVYHPKIHCHRKGDSGDCTATVTYAVNLNGEATTDQRGIRYIADNSSGFRDPHQTRRLIQECKSIAGVSHQNTIDLYARVLVLTHSKKPPTGSCIYYPIPICQNGEYMLTIKMTEGHYDKPDSKCAEARINDVPIMIHLDAFTLSGKKKCGTADVVLMFLAEGGGKEDFTLHLKGHDEPIQVKGGLMDLQFCFGYDCEIDNNFEASAFTLERLGTGTKQCRGLDSESECKYYNGNVPSRCWGHGCQYYLKGKERCATGSTSCEVKTYKTCICSHSSCGNLEYRSCHLEPPVFKNKLTCRRAHSYYVYHPKTLCYSEKDSGDCTATATFAVNLNGGATTDQRGIHYIADVDSGFRDPHQTRRLVQECKTITGVSHQDTVDLYSRVLVLTHSKKPPTGSCIYYPIPICQNGEYMLTIKMTEGHYDKPDSKCAEARINDVPIMIHMDAFTLSGKKKCGTADVVLMFLAEGKGKEDFTLHLKGHDEPIHVKGGQMDLQFCFGYDCEIDNNFEASAFTLERLGKGTKECKR